MRFHGEIFKNLLKATGTDRNALVSSLVTMILSALLSTSLAGPDPVGARPAAAMPPASGIIQQERVPNQLPPSPVTQVMLEPRFQEIIYASQQINALATKVDMNRAQQSEIIISSVNAINAVNRTPTLVRKEKNDLIKQITDVISFLAAEDSLQGQGEVKTDLIKAAVATIASAVSDPNTDPIEKKLIANFVTDLIRAICTDPRFVGAEVVGLVQRVLDEAKKLQQKAATESWQQLDQDIRQVIAAIDLWHRNVGPF